MITDGTPSGPLAGEVVICGHPWHGLVLGGVLHHQDPQTLSWNPLLVAGQPVSYPQPDSGDTLLARLPAAQRPTVARDEAAQARDTAAGHQWLDHELMAGWARRQLWARPMAEGDASDCCLFGVAPGATWWVDLSGLTAAGGSVSGNVRLIPAVFRAAPAPVLLPVSVTGLDLAIDAIEFYTAREDGGVIILGGWKTGETAHDPYVRETLETPQRGEATTSQTDLNLSTTPTRYRVPPLLYLRLDLTATQDPETLVWTPAAALSSYLSATAVAATDVEHTTHNTATGATSIYVADRPNDIEMHGECAVGTEPPAWFDPQTDVTYFAGYQHWHYDSWDSVDVVCGVYFPPGATEPSRVCMRYTWVYQEDSYLTVPPTCSANEAGDITATNQETVTFTDILSLRYGDGPAISTVRLVSQTTTTTTDCPVFPGCASAATTLSSTATVAWDDATLLTATSASSAYALSIGALPGYAGRSAARFYYPKPGGGSALATVHVIRPSHGVYAMAIRGLPDGHQLGGLASTITGAPGDPVGQVTGDIVQIESALHVAHHPITGEVYQSDEPVAFV